MRLAPPWHSEDQIIDPFSSRVPPYKLFSAEQSVGYLIDVISKLEPEQSGGFFAWDGSHRVSNATSLVVLEYKKDSSHFI